MTQEELIEKFQSMNGNCFLCGSPSEKFATFIPNRSKEYYAKIPASQVAMNVIYWCEPCRREPFFEKAIYKHLASANDDILIERI